MYSVKKHFVRYFISLCLADTIIILLKMSGITSFGLIFILQIAIALGFVYYGKVRLYRILKEERADIIQKYRFGGYFGTWEWNIIKAAKEQKDSLLTKVRNQVLAINIMSLLFIPNFVILINILAAFN